MQLELKSLRLENYKAFSEFVPGKGNAEFEFGHKNIISGRNKQGKSTIANAYLDILTGKDADSNEPNGIRPIVDGKEIPKIDIIRSATLSINGNNVEIKKITKQKWKRPRGQSEEVFDGNVTSYEIDGFPYTASKFAEYVSANICKPDVLLSCSNPNVFLSLLNKSTVEARKFLENISGFDLNKFIEENSFSEVGEISKGHSIEDTLKVLKKQLAEQKKKNDKKSVEIQYERSIGAEDKTADIEKLNADKAEAEEIIKSLDAVEENLNNNAKAYDEKAMAILSLKEMANKTEAIIKANYKDLIREHNDKVFDIKKELADLDHKLVLANADKRNLEKQIEIAKNDLEKAQDSWKEKSAEVFDESNIEAIKAEAFDETSTICPTCHQALPEADIERLKVSFEESKARRIEREENRKREFYEALDRQLEYIKKNGELATQTLKEAKESLEKAKAEIIVIEANREAVAKKLEEAEAVMLPSAPDISINPEYKRLSEEISALEAELSHMSNYKDDREEARKSRDAYIKKIADIEAEIKAINKAKEDSQNRLKTMESELREMAQTAADIERQIYVLTNFSIKKNEALADLINPYFKEFQFGFLSYTQDNNPVEVCEMIRNGIRYRNLNYSDQLICKVDLMCGLQKLQNVSLPIFADNAESINDDRLPETDRQIIFLKVTDEDLKVEEI